MSRATKAYASAYQPGRVHESSIAVGESRLYECDFNGALGGETIVSAQWDIGSSGTLSASGLTQAAGVVSVSVEGVVCGSCVMVCKGTTSAGRILGQAFCVSIRDRALGEILTWTAA